MTARLIDRAVRDCTDPNFWQGRRVLVTGHTGFIGGWLCARLDALGAQLSGLALAPRTQPSFYELSGLGNRILSIIGDIRSSVELARLFAQFEPQIVFHLAAQALVGEGFDDPRTTFDINVIGTVNVLEQCRLSGPEALVVMTSDKVYATGQHGPGYREVDRLGPSDPYGASKACCELAVEAYARSFFSASEVGIASVRAGNVIGGGDWAPDRLMGDAVRAFAAGKPLVLRRPDAVRPWQHVLDAVNGLLLVAQTAGRQREPIGAWNIGPPPGAPVSAGALASLIAAQWGRGAVIRTGARVGYPEALHLSLDSARARSELGLRAPWTIEWSVAQTVAWYKAALAGGDVWALTQSQIAAYDAAVRSVAPAETAI